MNVLYKKSLRPVWVSACLVGRFLSLLILSLIVNLNSIYAQADGAKLFKQNCAVCHSLGSNKVTGPGLAGVATRVPQPADEWMHKWIKNNEKVRKSGDAYGNKIYQDNGAAQMTSFEFLSDDEISALITYVKNPPVEKKITPTGTVASTSAEATGVDPFFILLGIISFLIIIISVLRGVKHSLKTVVNQKQGLPEEPHLGFWEQTIVWMSHNKRWVAVIVIFLTLWGSEVAWYSLLDIGVYQGYQPEQPIKFSHKIHAGDNAINCVYCHSGVEKGKTAGIPAVNVCMNCHKGISSGPTTGTEEIAKIYEAAGFDPATSTYNKAPKPVKWIRVHSLPDFVYFNHSQHVVVGKQECQTCHGEIQTMSVVKQHSPLTMGWCIDCHKTTEVKMEGNPYYEDFHKKLALKYKGQKITVDKMGGIECGKCHY